MFRTSGVSHGVVGKNQGFNQFPSQIIFMLVLVEGVMPSVKKERYLTLCRYAAGRCSLCVMWDKLTVLLHVCME